MNFTENLGSSLKNLTEKGAFLSVKSPEGINTMTIAWGFAGMIWQKPYFIALVRPQRYTKKILEKANSFTVSVPEPGAMDEQLKVCGSKSGRDINKAEIVEFAASKSVESPIVKGCKSYYECKISMVQRLDGSLIPEEVKKQFYSDDYHFMYFGEITECYFV